MALAALPADGIATFLMPSSTHIETAQERPRALNDAGGIEPFVLHPKRFRADARAQTAGPHQRRPALAQRDDRRFGRRQHRRVAPHVRRTVGHIAPRPAVPDDSEIVAHQQRSAARAQVGHRRRIILGAAEAAFQMGRFRHSTESLTSGSPRAMAPGGALCHLNRRHDDAALPIVRILRRQSFVQTEAQFQFAALGL